jgi:type IV pilus assembly protein PilO
MANFSEISGIKQWGLTIGAAVLVSVALFFTYFKTQRQANDAAQDALTAKLQENAQLAPYRTKLADIDRQIANLKQQLDIEQRIVPDQKEVDGFMRMLDAEALKAGVILRRYTALPVSNKEFYSEVPFEVELDGPYFSMLTFFDQVSKLERMRAW